MHATSAPPNNKWDFEIFDYQVYKRPNLDRFLNNLTLHFDVAVWSSASDDYVQEIVKIIFPASYDLKFVWGRSRCVRKINYESVEEYGYFDESNHLNYIKPLKKIKGKVPQSLNQILIIDDTPEKCRDNYGNAIYPSEFTGNPNDDELELLWKYLLSLKDEKNVRSIEKRGWRNKVH